MDHYSTARLTNHQFSVWQRSADFDVKFPGLDTVQSNNIIWVFRREADSASQILSRPEVLSTNLYLLLEKLTFLVVKSQLDLDSCIWFCDSRSEKGLAYSSPPYSSSHVVPHPAWCVSFICL